MKFAQTSRLAPFLFLLVMSCVSAMAQSFDHLVNLKKMGKIRVISIPESDLVRVALTPKLLAANYRGLLEFDRSAPEWAEFEKAVEQTNIIASTSKGDHRWAVFFQTSSG